MILYVDTSVVVPMLFDEPTSGRCRSLWESAGTRVSVRMTYVEAAAASASAYRAGRISTGDLESARLLLDELWADMIVVECDEDLMQEAAACAHRFGLRGYDAIQCAAGICVSGIDMIAASGDRQLLAGWSGAGLAVADTALT